MANAAMEQLQLILIGMAVVLITGFLMAFSWLWGKLADPDFRCKFYRTYLGKDAYILGIFSKDLRSIKRVVFNAESDVIMHDSNMWLVLKGRVVREDKSKNTATEGVKDLRINIFPAKQKEMKVKEETGFFIDAIREKIKWEEGVPVIYVHSDNFIPLSFGEMPVDVKSEEIGATINAYNQLMFLKALRQAKMLEYMVVVSVIMSVLCLGVAALNYFTMSSVQAQTQHLNDYLLGNYTNPVTNVTVPNSVIRNGELIISPPR